MIAAAEEKRLTEKAAEKKKRGDDVREAERAVVRKKALEASNVSLALPFISHAEFFILILGRSTSSHREET